MAGERDVTDLPDPNRIESRQDFARDLTTLREAAGLTVRDVARAVGLPASTVGDYFGGRHLPPPSQPHIIERVLRACGVDGPALLAAWDEALRRVRRSPGPRPRTTPTPYMGLSTFQREHAEFFFGREQLTDLLLGCLGESLRDGRHLVAVVGPSGSGKSSLLRAGLIPAVDANRLADVGVHGWETIVFAPGEKPLAELAERLVDVLPVDRDDAEEALRSGHGVRALVAGDGRPMVGLLVVVDQFEEVFAACPDEGERRAFIAALHELGQAHTDAAPVLVVLGMRADFYGHALRYELLVPALQHGQVVVGPMTEDELRRAIQEPARRVQAEVEDGLVALLLRDVAPAVSAPGAAHDAGALPLLSHALLATWERGRRARMTVADYRDSGGISRAIAQTAEDVYRALRPSQQELARQLFLRLIHVAPDMMDTRRRAPLLELQYLDEDHADEGSGDDPDDALGSIVERFIDSRLLTAEAEHVEIAHEALLHAWPRLRSWIDADRAGIQTHRRLTEAARIWQETAHDPAGLYRGGRLSMARDWAGERRHERLLNPLERSFLEASGVHAKAERDAARRRTRRLYQLVAALGILVLVAAGLAGYALRQGSIADHQRDVALSRQIAITANNLRGKDIALAAQLSLVAYQIAPTVEARSSVLQSYGMPTVTRLTTPSGYLQTVAMRPDGRAMATAGPDGALQLWDLTTTPPSKLGLPLAGHTGSLYGLAFSPDGAVLASAGEDRTIRLWDVTGGRRVGGPGVTGGRSVGGPGVTGGRSVGGARVTAPEGATALAAPLTAADDTIYSLAFSPDGRTLAAGSADGTVRLWDLTRPAAPVALGQPLTGATNAVQAVAFRPDGRVLAAGSADRSVRLWDISDRTHPAPATEPLSGPGGTVFAVAFSPDGRTLVAGSGDYSVWLWDVSSPGPAPGPATELTGASSWVNAVAFSPDGATLAAGSSDGNVWLWQVGTHALIRTIPHPAPVTSLAFAPDGTRLVTTAADGVARLWGVTAPTISGPTTTVFSVRFGQRDRVALGSADGAQTWNVADPRAPVDEGPPTSWPAAQDHDRASGAAGLSRDGRMIAVGGTTGTVQLWVVDGGEPALEALLTGPTGLIEWVDFSPDGRLVAAGSRDEGVWLWDTATPQRPGRVLRGHTNYVYSVAFSPDGRTLASGSIDSTVRLWDVSDPGAPAPLGEPLVAATSYVTSVAFSPDGRLLAAGTADNTVRLWSMLDRADPREVGVPLTGPHNYVHSVAFSPDSRTLAAAGGDGTAWLWDMTTPDAPSVVAVIEASTELLYAVAFHPDRGTLLATGGADRMVRFWETDTQRVISAICASAGDSITPAEWAEYVPDTPFHAPCPATA